MTAFISVIIQGTFRFRHIPWWEPLVQGWRQATNPASWLMIVALRRYAGSIVSRNFQSTNCGGDGEATGRRRGEMGEVSRQGGRSHIHCMG